MQGRTFIVAIVALVIGFAAGFIIRPLASHGMQGVTAAPIIAEPRSKSYFAAHIEEARQIIVQCTDGVVRGEECANAEIAVTEADGRARLKKFMGN